MKSAKSNANNRPKAKEIILGYFTVLAIMLMLFGTLLLPSTHVVTHDKGIIEEITQDVKTSAYTPFVNKEFIFYWSPIDAIYEQEDNEQNCP